MSELDDGLISLTSWLDRTGIPYMVIGDFAVAIWENRGLRAISM